MGVIVLRFLRSALTQSLSEDYVRTARSCWTVGNHRCTSPCAAQRPKVPTAVVACSLRQFRGGARDRGSVWAIPGLGRLTLDAVITRDYTLIQAIVLVVIVAFFLVNLAVDVIYVLLIRGSDSGDS